MSYVQYGVHQTEAERAVEGQRREVEQHLKELEAWQRSIVTVLGIMIRGGASKATRQQLETAMSEYGERFSAIMEYANTFWLASNQGGR